MRAGGGAGELSAAAAPARLGWVVQATWTKGVAWTTWLDQNWPRPKLRTNLPGKSRALIRKHFSSRIDLQVGNRPNTAGLSLDAA